MKCKCNAAERNLIDYLDGLDDGVHLSVYQVLQEQRSSEGNVLYLIQQGIFYHAYAECAAFMRLVTGYRIRKVRYRDSMIDSLGIPCSVILSVVDRILILHPTCEIEHIGKHYKIKLQ